MSLQGLINDIREKRVKFTIELAEQELERIDACCRLASGKSKLTKKEVSEMRKLALRKIIEAGISDLSQMLRGYEKGRQKDE